MCRAEVSITRKLHYCIIAYHFHNPKNIVIRLLSMGSHMATSSGHSCPLPHDQHSILCQCSHYPCFQPIEHPGGSSIRHSDWHEVLFRSGHCRHCSPLPTVPSEHVPFRPTASTLHSLLRAEALQQLTVARLMSPPALVGLRRIEIVTTAYSLICWEQVFLIR